MRLISRHKGLIISLLVLIGAITLFYHGLLIHPHVLSRVDWAHFYNYLAEGQSYNQWFQTWGGYSLLSGPHAMPGEVFLSPLYFLMAKMHAFPPVGIYQFLLLVLSGISCYLLVYYYTRNVYASAFAGIFYATNWFLNNWAVSCLALTMGYALFPILFLLFDRALKKGGLKDISFFSLFAFIYITSSHIQCTYIAFFSLALFALMHAFLSRDGKVSASLAQTAKVCFSSLALLLGLLSYLLIPLMAGVTTAGLSISYTMEELVFHMGPLAQVFTLSIGHYSLAHSSNFFLFGILIAVLAFSALLFRRDKYTIFFAVAAGITLFLANGPQPPFASAFNWLWENFPGFDTFRSPKYLMLAALSYAFLSGVSIKFIMDKLKASGELKFPPAQTFLSVGLVGLIIAINFLSVKPLFTYSIRGFDPNQYPEYCETEEAYNLIAAQDDGIYTIFWFSSPDMALDESHTFTTIPPIQWLWTESRQPVLVYPVAIYDRPELYGLGKFVDNQMAEPTATKFMGFLGSQNVRYIVIDKQMRDASDYIDFFRRQDECHVFYEGETLIVFENDNAFSHLYATPASAELIGGLNSLSALQFLPNFSFSTANLLPNSSSNQGDLLILYDTDADEFIMLNAPHSGGVQRLDLDKYAKVPWWRDISGDELRYWCISDWWYSQGDYVFDYFHIRTGGENTIQIPFSVDDPGDYEMWLRIAFASGRGKLVVMIDGNDVLSLTPEADFDYGFKFVKVPLSLGKGEHTLELRNDGTGFNDVDEVFLIKGDAFDSLFSTAQDVPAKTAYYEEGEKLFGLEDLGDWSVYTYLGPSQVIADDEQSQFWMVPDPEQVHISDSTDIKRHGANSLKVDVSGQREHWTILYHKFSESEDWTQQDLISFYFYGENTGHSFGLTVEAPNYQPIEEFYWRDDFTGWEQFTFTLDKDKDWSQVKRLVIGIHQNPAEGTWYFDDLELVETIATPAMVIQSGDQPCQISAELKMLEPGNYMIAIRAFAGTPEEITRCVPYIYVTDDEQSQFWMVPDPEQVHTSDSTDIKSHGANSLKIDVSGQRAHWTILYHKFTEPEDWSQQDLISFYFYGENTGHSFGLTVEAPNYQPIESFNWRDDFTGWKQFIFTLDRDKDWSQVKRLVIGIHHNPAEGTWYFDDLTVGRMETEKVGVPPEDAKLFLTMNGDAVLFDNFSHHFNWLEAGAISLDGGQQTIELRNEGTIYLDKIVFYPSESQAPLASLFDIDNSTFLSYEKLSPTKYQVHVETDRPFWLVFPEIYHPLWCAHVDGQSIQSTETYLGFNSFYIAKTGEYNIVLEFKGQQYMKYGAIVSGITFGFTVMGLVLSEERSRKRLKSSLAFLSAKLRGDRT